MRVWNANPNKLDEIQKSTIPLPSVARSPTACAARLEELVENTLSESNAYVRERGKKRGVKKRTNDSVSPLERAQPW